MRKSISSNEELEINTKSNIDYENISNVLISIADKDAFENYKDDDAVEHDEGESLASSASSGYRTGKSCCNQASRSTTRSVSCSNQASKSTTRSLSYSYQVSRFKSIDENRYDSHLLMIIT